MDPKQPPFFRLGTQNGCHEVMSKPRKVEGSSPGALGAGVGFYRPRKGGKLSKGKRFGRDSNKGLPHNKKPKPKVYGKRDDIFPCSACPKLSTVHKSCFCETFTIFSKVRHLTGLPLLETAQSK